MCANLDRSRTEGPSCLAVFVRRFSFVCTSLLLPYIPLTHQPNDLFQEQESIIRKIQYTVRLLPNLALDHDEISSGDNLMVVDHHSTLLKLVLIHTTPTPNDGYKTRPLALAHASVSP